MSHLALSRHASQTGRASHRTNLAPWGATRLDAMLVPAHGDAPCTGAAESGRTRVPASESRLRGILSNPCSP
jgi:hypothetical protein